MQLMDKNGGRVNTINWDTTCLSELGEVKSIAFDIMGKADNAPVTLTLWADDESIKADLSLEANILQRSPDG